MEVELAGPKEALRIIASSVRVEASYGTQAMRLELGTDRVEIRGEVGDAYALLARANCWGCTWQRGPTLQVKLARGHGHRPECNYVSRSYGGRCNDKLFCAEDKCDGLRGRWLRRTNLIEVKAPAVTAVQRIRSCCRSRVPHS